MATLIVLLPSGEAGSSDAWAATPMPFALLDRDGAVRRTGQAALDALPRVGATVLVLAARDTLLLNVKLPPVTGARLRRALPNVVEEHLIQDAQRAHIALDPAPLETGERCLAVIDKTGFAAVLAHFSAAGHRRLRAVPLIRCIPLSDASQHAPHASNRGEAGEPAEAVDRVRGEVPGTADADATPTGSIESIRAAQPDAASAGAGGTTTQAVIAAAPRYLAGKVHVDAIAETTSALIVHRRSFGTSGEPHAANDLQATVDALAGGEIGGNSDSGKGTGPGAEVLGDVASTTHPAEAETVAAEWVELAVRQGALGFGMSVRVAQLDATLAELARHNAWTVHTLALEASDTLCVPAHQHTTPLPWPTLARAALECRFDLCQFAFANTGTGRAGAAGIKPWRVAIGFVAASALVSLIAVNVQCFQLRARRDALDAQMAQAVKAVFPSTAVILDPHAQMRSNLVRLRTAAGELRVDDFLALAGGLSHSLGPVPSASIATLDYSGATLEVTFKPGTEVDARGLKQRLAANGLSAQEEEGKWLLKSAPSRPQ